MNPRRSRESKNSWERISEDQSGTLPLDREGVVKKVEAGQRGSTDEKYYVTTENLLSTRA